MKYDLILNENTDSKIIDRYYFFEDDIAIRFLPNINSINIFVEANNSGKSWMMRHLMQLKNYKNVHFSKINNLTIYFNNTLGQNILANQAKGINFYDENLPTFEIERFNNKSFSEIAKIAKQNHSNFKQLSNIGRNRRSYYNVVIDESKMIYLDTINNQIIDLIEDNLEYENPDKIYIPTLRTAHSLYNYKEEKYLKIEDDIFYNTLQRNHPTENVKTFTGLHLYKSILNARNARKEIRKRFEDFEIFIQNNFSAAKRLI